MFTDLLWEYKDVFWNLECQNLSGKSGERWRQYYRCWPILKPNGKKRWIHAPQGRLKQLQKALLPYLINEFPLHPAARAYRKGQGGHEDIVKEHANFSKGQAIFFEVDIKDFFGHVTGEMLHRCGVPQPAIRALTILHPYRGWVLPQGSPTSPAASNLVMREFDEKFSETLPKDSLYTRYADNLGVSLLTSVPRKQLVRLTQDLLKSYGFQLNWDKVKYRLPQQGQTYLGLNMKGGEVRTLRDYSTIKLRSKVHHFKMGDTTKASLEGMTNYMKQVNPEQYEQEIRRHGIRSDPT
jgi:RNA-directed DNA polymerase